MAIAFVQQAGNKSSSTNSLAVTIAAPAAGNALVLWFGSNAVTVSSIAGGGVTWAKLKSSAFSNYDMEVWYGLNSSGSGTTVTATLSGTAFALATVAEFSGILSSGAADASTDTDSGTSAGPATGPITASASPALVLGGLINGSDATTSAIQNGFTGLTDQFQSPLRLTGAYLIQSTATSVGTGWTLSGSTQWEMSFGALLGATDTNAPGGNAAGTGASYVAGPTVKVGALIASAVATVSQGEGSDLSLEVQNAATATGAAHTAVPWVQPSATAGTATGTAYQPPVAAAIGNAAGTGAAGTATATVKPSAGAAAIAATANAAVPSVGPSAGLASPAGSAAAYAATIDKSTYAAAEAVAATGAAGTASTTVKPSAAVATATAAASGPGVVTDSATLVASGYASAQAEAVLAFAAIGAASGYGSGTGAAHDASVTVSVAAGVSAATAAALVARSGSFTGPSRGPGPRGSVGRPRPHAISR